MMGRSPRLREVTIQGPSALARSKSRDNADPLLFSEMILLLDELAEMPHPPERVRLENFELSTETIGLVEYARARRLKPRLRLAAESLSGDAVEEVASETGAIIVIPIEGSVSPARGDFAIRIAEHAASIGVEIEIETLLRPFEISALPSLASFIKASGFRWWQIDFLGDPAENAGLLYSRETARAFASLAGLRQGMETALEIREAPSFRRYMKEKVNRRGHEEVQNVTVMTSRDTLLITPSGEVMPGRSLRLPVGNVRTSEIQTIVARSELLTAIRDPDRLGGRCGVCELNDVCGGSRARAWRVSRNLLAEDPGCFRAPARARAKHNLESTVSRGPEI